MSDENHDNDGMLGGTPYTHLCQPTGRAYVGVGASTHGAQEEDSRNLTPHALPSSHKPPNRAPPRFSPIRRPPHSLPSSGTPRLWSYTRPIPPHDASQAIPSSEAEIWEEPLFLCQTPYLFRDDGLGGSVLSLGVLGRARAGLQHRPEGLGQGQGRKGGVKEED